MTTERSRQSGDEDVELLVLRYLDGELSDRETAELEQRLRHEPQLEELLRQSATLDGRLADLRDRPVEGVDEELLRADIVAALERKALLEGAARRRRIPRPWAAVLAAAAVVAVAATVTLTLMHRPEGPTAEPAPTPHPLVSASVLPAGARTTGGVVEARPLPLRQMQLRLSREETPLVANVPAGTVYVSSGARHILNGAGQGGAYPMWPVTETN